ITGINLLINSPTFRVRLSRASQTPDKKAKPEKDTEIIPWKEDVKAYMEKNVLPFQPKAKINEKQTKIGYEIPFTRVFYKYVPLEASENIFAKLKDLEAKETELMNKILG
ncbi:MAG: hypothetical protein MJZ52_06300, partial [Bacteroidales bacterium]|nr:hypothetical protein [Bacteroidales bacterium]